MTTTIDGPVYRPLGGARHAFRDRSPEVVLEGPAGTGKTRAVLEKLNHCASKYPRMRGLICRKTRESITESVLVTWERAVLWPGHPALQGPARAGRQRYNYPNGSEIVVAGLLASGHDMRAKIMSTDFDMVVVPEATELNEEDWEKLVTRLRNNVMPYQQIVGDCNPDAPTHWLHQRCDKGGCQVYFSRHADNPSVTPEYLLKLQRLTGVRRARLFEGRRVAAEGTVYEFDRAVHLIDPDKVPKFTTRFRSIDFGYTNPFVCQFWGLDHDGRMYLYRELYRTKRTVTEHAPVIKRMSAGESFAATVADHDAEDCATLRLCGIHPTLADKAITAGIQAVEDRLAVAGDGKPRLFVVRGALQDRDEELAESKLPTCTEQEFDAYAWPKGGDGKSIKEKPVDLYNHGMDALRYAVRWADARQRMGDDQIYVPPEGERHGFEGLNCFRE